MLMDEPINCPKCGDIEIELVISPDMHECRECGHKWSSTTEGEYF
tara:strand:+ start:173 stop:307 length:135 start_codon:yes stop_codon:yes gene_type:complete